MGTSAITGVSGGTPAFQEDFVNANLVSGVLTVTHSLNSQYVSVTVYNNDDLIIIPDDVDAISTTQCTIDLTSYGNIGALAWRAIVLDQGATLSVVHPDFSVVGETQYDRLYFDGAAWVSIPVCYFESQADGSDTNIPTGTTILPTMTELFNLGGHVSAGVLTAPVDGYYQLNAEFYLNDVDNAATSYNCRIAILGVSVSSHYATFDPESGDADRPAFTNNVSCLTFMTDGDTARINVTQSGGSAQTDINAQTKFSGYLVIPA